MIRAAILSTWGILTALIGLSLMDGQAVARPARAGHRAAVIAPLPPTAPLTEIQAGNPKSNVTVIEYASVACPACAAVNEDLMPDFKRDYIDTGKVNYVYKPMLTGNMSIAAAGELLARCAGKDKYFTAHDAIMRAQTQLYPMGKESGPEVSAATRPVLLSIAGNLGLSESDFDKCTTNQAGLESLFAAYYRYLDADKVDSTPTFFINNVRYDGEMTTAALAAAVDAALTAPPVAAGH